MRTGKGDPASYRLSTYRSFRCIAETTRWPGKSEIMGASANELGMYVSCKRCKFDHGCEPGVRAQRFVWYMLTRQEIRRDALSRYSLLSRKGGRGGKQINVLQANGMSLVSWRKSSLNLLQMCFKF